MTNFYEGSTSTPVEHELEETSPPECPESCELKQQFLETPKEEFNSKKVSTDFMLQRDIGDVEGIEELFAKETLNVLLEENRLKIIQLEQEIEEIKGTLYERNNRLKQLKGEFLKLIPFDTGYIKEIINGYSEEK